MKIGIIGAGFTGLASAYNLQKSGHNVTVFEKDDKPGGLAVGYQEKGWDWTLEKHYHHWFTNDDSILSLAKEINFPVLIKRQKTSVYVDDEIYQLDSPKAVLSFPKLPLIDRIRMATSLGLLRYNPLWQPLEKFHAVSYLKKTMGKKAYDMLWEPQLNNKFGQYKDQISLAWFWARVNKRTPSLAYPEGGFLRFAEFLTDVVQKQGGNVYFDSISKAIKRRDCIYLTVEKNGKEKTWMFDKLIVTLPTFSFIQMTNLPTSYTNQLGRLKGLGAINLILRLKKKFINDNTYWLSVCEKNSPVMAVVEHTNFMNSKYYNNEHLVYLGNYLPSNHPYFNLSAENLLKEYDSFLQKINPGYQKNIIGAKVFHAPFAQPIIPTNYSKSVPSFKTPIPDVFLANMQQVYPWDRGTNYAVELGQKVAKLII